MPRLKRVVCHTPPLGSHEENASQGDRDRVQHLSCLRDLAPSFNLHHSPPRSLGSRNTGLSLYGHRTLPATGPLHVLLLPSHEFSLQHTIWLTWQSAAPPSSSEFNTASLVRLPWLPTFKEVSWPQSLRAYCLLLQSIYHDYPYVFTSVIT